MVMPWPCGVHAERAPFARHPAFPQPAGLAGRHADQSWGISCAQTAIIPTNSVIDASAAASSTNILNMSDSYDPRTYEEHCSFFVLGVKRSRTLESCRLFLMVNRASQTKEAPGRARGFDRV